MLSFLRSIVSQLCLVFFSLLFPGMVWAESTNPAGLWKSIDENTGKPRVMVRITESNGILEGKVERVFPKPGEGTDPKCVKCEGALKNASVTGLVIMNGYKKNGDEYIDGKILDPDTGSTYSSKLKVVENGQKLSLRGYIGVPLLGRTQTWIREE